MINYIYNEYEYGKFIYDNGFLTSHKMYELKVLAKYLKFIEKKPKERKEIIYDFCQKHIDNFNRATHFRMVNSVLNHAKNKNNNIVIIDKILVTESEMDYISGLQLDYMYRKILFTLLVTNKLFAEFNKQKNNAKYKENVLGGVNRVYKQIFESAKIPSKILNEDKGKKCKINKIIKHLIDLEYLTNMMGGKVRLDFVDKIDNDDHVAFEVTTFDDIGLYFDLYYGLNNVIRCECGRIIKKTNNKHRMCRECWKDKEKDIKRKVWHENKKRYRR